MTELVVSGTVLKSSRRFSSAYVFFNEEEERENKICLRVDARADKREFVLEFAQHKLFQNAGYYNHVDASDATFSIVMFRKILNAS